MQLLGHALVGERARVDLVLGAQLLEVRLDRRAVEAVPEGGDDGIDEQLEADRAAELDRRLDGRVDADDRRRRRGGGLERMLER